MNDAARLVNIGRKIMRHGWRGFHQKVLQLAEVDHVLEGGNRIFGCAIGWNSGRIEHVARLGHGGLANPVGQYVLLAALDCVDHTLCDLDRVGNCCRRMHH